MSNHVHIVLCVNKEAALSWSLQTVLHQWHKMHKGTVLTQKFMKGEILSESEYGDVKSTADVYRKRLYDISWFMRNLNEYIARKANEEDDCTGRFWEGRFRSQALLTEKLYCHVCICHQTYTRKGRNVGLQDSYHTSINKRRTRVFHKTRTIKGLMLLLKSHQRCRNTRGLDFTLNDYCNLLNQSIELLRDTDSTAAQTSPIQHVKPLGVCQHHWHHIISDFENVFSVAAGDGSSMRKFQANTKRKRMAKISSAAICFD